MFEGLVILRDLPGNRIPHFIMFAIQRPTFQHIPIRGIPLCISAALHVLLESAPNRPFPSFLIFTWTNPSAADIIHISCRFIVRFGHLLNHPIGSYRQPPSTSAWRFYIDIDWRQPRTRREFEGLFATPDLWRYQGVTTTRQSNAIISGVIGGVIEKHESVAAATSCDARNV